MESPPHEDCVSFLFVFIFYSSPSFFFRGRFVSFGSLDLGWESWGVAPPVVIGSPRILLVERARGFVLCSVTPLPPELPQGLFSGGFGRWGGRFFVCWVGRHPLKKNYCRAGGFFGRTPPCGSQL